MEIWKPVPEYEGIYEVSDRGNVRSVRDSKNTFNGKILKARLRPNGYRQFGLTKDRKTRYFKASRLVASTFLSNPSGKPTVNHKNGIKHDDRVENLEWATVSENTQHAFDNGLAKARFGEKHRNVRLKELGVILIRGLLKSGYKPSQIAEIFGVHKMTISDIKWGRTWGWLA